MMSLPPGANPDVKLKSDLQPSGSCERGSNGNSKPHDNSQEYYGDKLAKKSKNTVRVVLNNVNSIGLYANGIKDELIREFMCKWDVDILGLTEANVHWGKVKKKDNWYERTESWFESRRLAVAYNTTSGQLAKRGQYGGTITMARDDISHRAVQSGYDASGLGRWSWITFKGKRNCTTRVVTAYCPVKNAKGVDTVYAQHLRHLHKCPLQAFWSDLKEDVKKWQLDGEQLILMGDWNTEMMDDEFFAWRDELGLVDVVTDTHGDEDAPSTFNRGKRRIDGILISPSLLQRKNGYLSFNALPGDHRAIFLDITVNSFVGYRAPPIPSHKARRLKLDDPRVVQRYQEVHDKYLQDNSAYKRLQVLERKVLRNGSTFSPELSDSYEEIELIREKAMQYAERKCRKLRMGGRQWSPALQKARDTILLWELVVRRHLGRNVSARTIIRLRKKLKISNSNVSLPTAHRNVDESYKSYKKLRKIDKRLSRTYREELATARAEAGNNTIATEIRNIQVREQQRTTSRRIKTVFGRGRGQGTSKIEITLEDGSIKEITRQGTMERHIIRENRNKVHQSENCPLFHDDLVKDLGFMGDGPEVDNVLDGSYLPPEGIGWATARWLKHMKRTNPVAQSEISTSLKDYRHGWKLTKERTASGELHMGHFKAGAMHKKIGWFNFVMAVLPYSSGYVPNRWRQGTDVMLLKKNDVYLLDKLRTIVLYEADFNHENKRLGRNLMNMALDKKLVANEQFCRPGRSAQENAVCKRLIFDHIRTKKKAFGMCSCDLKSCYDRIVHTAASIAMQRVGISLSKIQSMFGCVQKLVHRIRTLFGDSEDSYGGNEDTHRFKFPPQGAGQGNGAAPSIWSVLSSTIFEILHEEGYSSTFVCALSCGLFKLCGFSYVDDCDLFRLGDNPASVAAEMKGMLAMWDHLMEVTGAAIAPDKCWWYLADFSWKDGKWTMVDAGAEEELTVRDKDGNICPLTYLRVSESKEMLGIFLAPDGNDKAQLKKLKSKVHSWVEFLSTGGLDWGTVWTALRTTIMKSIAYALPATSFTEKQIKEILVPLYRVALPRSGFTMSYPRDVLHGPVALQGNGLDYLYDMQYTNHIRDILDYGHKQNVTGKFVRLAIEGIKLEAGIQGPLFEFRKSLPYLNTTNSWVYKTWLFCREHDIEFDEKCGNIEPKRKNDKVLMESFLSAGYSAAELRILNRCRLYMRATTLSDLTTGDGQRLQDDIFRGLRQLNQDSYDWPAQGKPPPREWNLWGSALRCCFAPTQGKLLSPLGEWLSDIPSESYYSEWEWWVDQSGVLFRFHNKSWFELRCVNRCSRRSTRLSCKLFHKLPSSYKQLPTRPSHIRRTTVTSQFFSTIQSQGSLSKLLSPTLPTDSTDLLSHARLHKEAWLFQYFDLKVDESVLLSLLANNQLASVSDGSFHPTRRTGSMGWCLAHKTSGKIVLQGGGLIPGTNDLHCSYRSEAGGLLASVTILEILESYFSITTPYSQIVACDGESALYRCLVGGRGRLSTSIKHCDIIAKCHDRIDRLSCSVVPTHVRGHQDDRGTNLTILEKINVKMDSLAKKIASIAKRKRILALTHAPITPDGYPTIYIRGVPIISEVERTLKNDISSNRIKQWWISKGRFTFQNEKEIDWDVMSRCSVMAKSRFSRFIPKWVSNQVAVGTTMARRKTRLFNGCPRCKCMSENREHVLKCPEASARAHWKTQVTLLKNWCVKSDTHPDIIDALYDTLIYWQSHKRSDHYVDYSWDDDIAQTFRHQAKLGWNSFLDGLLSTRWAELQQSYYDETDSMKKGSKWAGTLSYRIWIAVHSMWMHRNSHLHDETTISEFTGSRALRLACVFEFERGTDGIDELYHPYLDISLDDLLKESIDFKRNWFAIIRQARENTGFPYSDQFASNAQLRSWAGLSPLPILDSVTNNDTNIVQ